MKVEIEIPDLEEIYYSYSEEGVKPKDFKEAMENLMMYIHLIVNIMILTTKNFNKHVKERIAYTLMKEVC